MAYTLSQEERETLQVLKKDLIGLSVSIKSIGLIILSALAEGIIRYIRQLSDFSPENIKNKGLVTILYERSLRFFCLERNDKQNTTIKRIKRAFSSSKEARDRRGERISLSSKSIIRIIFFPFYILICFILWVRRRKMKKFVNRV
jgi:hypothetical protein